MDFYSYKLEIESNKKIWERKTLLRKIYYDFYEKIRDNLSPIDCGILEIGSGIGSIKTVIPEVILTDVVFTPYIDFVQSAYNIAVKDGSLSNIILFDVFHHLKYPLQAFKEFYRVLKKKGRVIIFEPFISYLGFLVYGLFHKEPIKWREKIEWNPQILPNSLEYYSAQGNATRIFSKKEYNLPSEFWEIITLERYSAISYILSGGYSGPQLYPPYFYNFFKYIDKFFDLFPRLFATRMLVVIEKK